MAALGNAYNLNYEPYRTGRSNNVRSKDDKDDGQENRTTRLRAGSNHSDPEITDANMDLRFQYAGPKRQSDERHYFKTIQNGYQNKISSKRGSLDDL